MPDYTHKASLCVPLTLALMPVTKRKRERLGAIARTPINRDNRLKDMGSATIALLLVRNA